MIVIRRFLAFYFDLGITFFLNLGICTIYWIKEYGSINSIPGLSDQDINYMMFLNYLVIILYFFIFDLLNKQSIGKWLFRLKIIGFENNSFKSRLWKSLIRNFSRFIPFEPISILINEKHIMWHDKFSKTEVVDYRKK